MIDRLLGILFTLLLLSLGWVLAVLGSVHGPALFPYFVMGYAVVAVALLWACYWFVRRRGYRHKSLLFGVAGVFLGAALIGASLLSWGALVDWEVAQQERTAAATEVFNMHDEPLLSANGNPIGVRLRYSMRFPNSDYFWHTPSLHAEKDFGVSIWADGSFAEPTVTPPLIPGKNTAPRYEKGKQYDFTADILPMFLVKNKDMTKLCILEPPPDYHAAFERMVSSGETLHYNIGVNGTKFAGETRNAYSPRTFYESAVKDGAMKLEGSGLGGSMGRCQ